MQINDAVSRTLAKEGYPGGTDDQVVAWLLSVGATGGNVDDLWHSYWSLQAVPAGQFNDRYATWLTALGFTQGSLDDKQLAYWTDRYSQP